MHTHDHHESDPSLLRRIRGISWANGAIGAAELVAGTITGSSTLTMAGVHDASDGLLYRMKHRAACEKDHARKQRLRQRGALALIGAAVVIGGYEITQSITDQDHHPAPITAGIGIVAAAANITAACVMHDKRHHHDAQDSWKHVVGVDLPGSLITLTIVPLSVKYPELDVVGTAAHMALATTVGVSTLMDIRRDKPTLPSTQ